VSKDTWGIIEEEKLNHPCPSYSKRRNKLLPSRGSSTLCSGGSNEPLDFKKKNYIYLL